jgi:hypothetical protein
MMIMDEGTHQLVQQQRAAQHKAPAPWQKAMNASLGLNGAALHSMDGETQTHQVTKDVD